MPFNEPQNLGDVRELLQGKDIPAPDNAALQAVIASHGRDRILAHLKTLYMGGQDEARAAREKLNTLLGGHGTDQYAPRTQKSRGQSMNDSATPDARETGKAPFEFGLKAKVFGGKGAVSFEEDTRRDSIATISIQGAKAIEARNYDWKNKIAVQLTPNELATVSAVILGVLGECEFKSHGVNKDKGFYLARQDKGFFIKVFSSDGLVAVPITHEDAFQVGRVCMAQLKKAMPEDGLSGGELIALLKATIGAKG
ncbi:hypothetical protein [Thioalkalivibrio sp. ALE16]|uniref:hypothetical protein n=1 Tax=Thioalkalivibrio sp. ALE16 TaxID=1158172 RepID=UPI00037239C0|nr:hypothetical protein [Thioalkalivibrio sp. ALE16]